MEILIIACTLFIILNIHAYIMPIKKSVERIEFENCKLPFSVEENARTL